MKSKLLAFILIMVMSASIFYGCGLITKNNERDMAQVIAEVGDENYKDEILKEDLVKLYINQGSQYIQNYGLSASRTMEILMEQLINNRLIIQEGARALIEKNNLSEGISYYLSEDPVTKLKSDSLKKLVGDEAYEEVMSDVYKYEKETLDYYEEEYNKEQEAEETESATPTPTPTPTPRPTQQPDPLPTETPYTPNPIPSTEARIEALNRLKAALENNDKTYEDFLEETKVSYLENKIIELYQEYLQKDITISNEALTERYNYIKTQNEQQFTLDLSAYETKLKKADENTIILYNPVEGYGYVKNLLISFTDSQKAQLTEYQTMQWSQTKYNEHRSLLLEDLKNLTEVKDLRENIEEEDLENYVNLAQFLNDRIVNYQIEGVNLYSNTDANNDGVYENTTLSTEAKEDFINLIFQYGQDPGMFNNKLDYLVTPEPAYGERETFVSEFAEAARKVIMAGEGSYTLVGTDYGYHIIICTDVLNVGTEETLSNDIFNQIENVIENSQSEEDFENMDKEVKETLTYKLYNLMREEMKTAVFNTAIKDVIDNSEDKVTKYESRYEDLLAIE